MKVRPNPSDITKRLGPEFRRWFRGLRSRDRGRFLIMVAVRCHERHAETLTEYCDTWRETRIDFSAGLDVGGLPTPSATISEFSSSGSTGLAFNSRSSAMAMKDRTSEFLRQAIDKWAKARGMRFPLIVCAATPGGSIFCARMYDDGRPNDLLAEHTGPDNDDQMAPVACILVDQRGEHYTLTIEGIEAQGRIQ